MASEITEVIAKIMSHRCVKGVIIANSDGVPVKSTVDDNTATLFSGLLTQLCDKARSAVKELDSSNEFTFMRLRSWHNEILVAPDVNFLLIVIQASADSVEKKKGGKKKSSADDDDDEDEDEDEDGSKSGASKQSGEGGEGSETSGDSDGDDKSMSEGAK